VVLSVSLTTAGVIVRKMNDLIAIGHHRTLGYRKSVHCSLLNVLRRPVMYDQASVNRYIKKSHNMPSTLVEGSTFTSLFVDVTQLLMSNVHRVVDSVIVHNTIRRDRGRELREGSLAERVPVRRLRTFTKGGAPVGKVASGTKFVTRAVIPPPNDQKLEGSAFCQSYHSLSTI